MDEYKDFPWEDNLLERKVETDLKDILKTLVAFANSVMPGHTAVLLIGEKDDGTPVGVTDPDNIQKKVRSECEKIYPDIIWRSKVYEKDGKHCIRVEIEYSGNTPHFGGQSWIRKGSESIKASDEIFQRLIDIRSSKVTELAKWLNKEVIIYPDLGSVPMPRMVGGITTTFSHPWGFEKVTLRLIFVNNFYATFEDNNGKRISAPLDKLTLSFDNESNKLKIIVAY